MTMKMLPLAMLCAGVLVVGGSVLASSQSATPTAPPTAAEATATRSFEEAQLADLQTRVAGLSTRVAELGGAEDEALAGRLGGNRQAFDGAYGLPTAYIGPDQVQYSDPAIGRITVTFVDDQAQRVTVSPARPVNKPLNEADEQDWTGARASEIAAIFAPADGVLPALTGDTSAPDPWSGTSAALGGATVEQTADTCGPAGPRQFKVTFAGAAGDQISAVDLTVGQETVAAAPELPANGGRANRSVNAVANSSIGGTVSVNGLRMEATQVQDNATGPRPAADGNTWFAVDLSIVNEGRRTARFSATDFLLVDAAGQELTAVCGGVEPVFAYGDIASQQDVGGWITFQVPDGFVPVRMVILGPSARIGFNL